MPLLPIQRGHDAYIMDIALTIPNLRPAELRYINYCRYFVQTLTIADITTACGTKISQGISNGTDLQLLSTSRLDEPYQEKPGNRAWTAWRKFLKHISSPNGTLYRPLGPWLHRYHLLRRDWPYVYSPSLDTVYKHDPPNHVVYNRVRTRIYKPNATPATITVLPVDCVPVDCCSITDGWRISVPSPLSPTIQCPPTKIAASFDDYLDSIPDSERCLLIRYHLFDRDPYDTLEYFNDYDRVIIVSDGGALPDRGSFGWIIGLLDGTRLARGQGTVFGSNPSSYRAEISGCKAALLFLRHLHLYCSEQQPAGKLQYHCDNSGFIKKMMRFRSFPIAPASSCLHSDWDLLISAHRLFCYFPELPSIHHVKGHQDRTIPYEDLPLPAQMNIDADHLATSELLEFSRPQPTVPFDDTTLVQLSINGQTVTSNISRAVTRVMPR